MTGPQGMGPLTSGFASVLNPLVIFENFVESLSPTHWFKCDEDDGSLQNSGSGTGVFNPVEGVAPGIEYEDPLTTGVLSDIASVLLNQPTGANIEYFESTTLSPSVTANEPFSFFLMFNANNLPTTGFNRLLYHDGLDDASMFNSGLMMLIQPTGRFSTMLAQSGSVRASLESDVDAIVEDTFNTVGYTYDGEFARLFLNGVMIQKLSYSGGYSVNPSSNRVRLGFQNGSTGSDRVAWFGQFAHLIRWHDVVLTEENMTQLHNLSGGFDAPPVGTDRFTGGTITYDDGDVIHTFTADDTLTFLGGPPVDCHVLKVAGGGGGGSIRAGGGGGGGGVVDELSVMIGNTLTVDIGVGGTGADGIADNSAGRQGVAGGNTRLISVVSTDFGRNAIGGGGGVGSSSTGSASGGIGGCGGGGGAGSTNSGGNGSQGGDGGSGFPSGTVANRAGGGGGGALSSVSHGQNASSANGGDGGTGYNSDISGTDIRYGGGGGGGCGTLAGVGLGGLGGGTDGKAGNAACDDAAANTGGGGGGNTGGSGTGLSAAGDGGSGILVVRYPEGG